MRCTYTNGPVTCKLTAVVGEPYCRYHTGPDPDPDLVFDTSDESDESGAPRNSGSSRGHGSIRHGRYSKDLPRHLMDRFIKAATDPDILNMTNDIALIDTRVSEILERIAKGETTSGAVAWDEISDRLALRARLAESERKRLIEQGQSITVAQLMMLLRAISLVIKQHVEDEFVLTKIAAGISQLIDANATQATFIGLETLPESRRRWSYVDGDGKPDPAAPIMPQENLDASTRRGGTAEGAEAVTFHRPRRIDGLTTGQGGYGWAPAPTFDPSSGREGVPQNARGDKP